MRIHIISNSLRMNSGFSIVTRHLATGLKRLGHEVSMTAMQDAYTSSWHYDIEAFPVQVNYVDDLTQYMMTLDRVRPDVVLAIFQMDAGTNNPFAKVFPKTIVYCPVEGKNIPQGMANDLLQIKMGGGLIVAQCQYGRSEMRLALGGSNIECIYHGYNSEIFKPLNLTDTNNTRYCYYRTEDGQANSNPISLHQMGCYDCQLSNKEQQNCPHYKEEQVSILRFANGKWAEEIVNITDLPSVTKNVYVFGFIGQNIGVRKRTERLLEAYSIFIKGSKQLKDRTVLHLHTKPIAIDGINLIKVIQDLGIQNNIIFSYGANRSSGWTENAMNILYNTFDINVSASSSEGFCILPDSPILTLDRGVQKIKDIKIGDNVLTHKGRFMRVSQVMKREYHGDMIEIISHKLRIPICLTPEHRVLGIKTQLCDSNYEKRKDYICYPGRSCYFMKNGRQYKWCKHVKGHEPYTKYKTSWIMSTDLEKGDFVTYPKANEKEVDIYKIRILDYIDDFLNITGDDYADDSRQIDTFGDFVEKKISMNATYAKKYARIPAEVELTEDLMRLFGYFIAEGDIAGDRQIEFTFNINEDEYVQDVEYLMKDIFGLETEHITNKTINGEYVNVHILRYSNKVLSSMFQNMFCPKDYIMKKGKGGKSNIVRIPAEFLNLPRNKLSEIIKGIWRGDGSKGTEGTHGYVIKITSETLAYQLVYLLSKFGILSSFGINDANTRKNNKWSRSYKVEILGKFVDIFDKIIGEIHQFRDVETEKSRYVEGKNLYYIPIEKVNIMKYDGNVWNLEVEEDNSYVCPIVVHNCLPVLEGMATGLPMIAPNCSSFTELIGNDNDESKNRGLLASIGEWQMTQDSSYRALVSESDLALKMKKLYTDNKLREQYSKNAIKFASNYTWEKICQEWNKLLGGMK